MEKLRTPLLVNAIYVLLVGLIALSPSLTQTVFGYEVKDRGILLVFAAAVLGFGVVNWAIAGNTAQYGGLASAVVVAIVIFIVLLVWGWVSGLYTARNVLVPLILDVVLGGWIWSARKR